MASAEGDLQTDTTGRPPTDGRPRGNYWEITYKHQVAKFTSWPLATKAALATETGKTEVQVTADPSTRAINLSGKQFKTCDFNHFNLGDSSFSECTFIDCRFVKANFDHVKFSKCHFERCHFLNVRFVQCQFIACAFSKISASGETLRFERSSISAEAFVDALVTNVAALPKGVTAHYQQHRLLLTKAKVARGIFLSVRDEPELDQLFDANRCLEIALQRKRIAEAMYLLKGHELVKRNVFHRVVIALLHRAGLAILRFSGFLTNWGRSPLKTVWFLACTILIFASLYHLEFGQASYSAMLRALDCTFVFGYTRYAVHPDGPRAFDWVTFLNALAGFCWYALFIPALSKRLFR